MSGQNVVGTKLFVYKVRKNHPPMATMDRQSECPSRTKNRVELELLNNNNPPAVVPPTWCVRIMWPFVYYMHVNVVVSIYKALAMVIHNVNFTLRLWALPSERC